jgi:hypothetical protein
MTFTFKLQRLDGTPAVRPSIESSVLSWRPGNTIPLGRRSLQVVRVRDDDTRAEPQPPRRLPRPGAAEGQASPDPRGRGTVRALRS